MLHELKESIYNLCQPILDFCTSLGETGLFILSFVESVFFPIPPDFIYIPMILNNHPNPYMLALIATIGSVMGAVCGYYIGLLGGRPVAEKFLPIQYINKAESFFDRFGSMAILISAFTPIPYKVFTITSGMCRMSKRNLIFFSILGRGGRFFAVTFILANYGEAIMKHFFNWSLIAAVLVIISYIGFNLVKSYRKKRVSLDES